MHKPITFPNRVSVVFFLVLCGITRNAAGQNSAPSDSLGRILIEKEAEMFRMITTGDRAAAENMIGEDYVTINADGVMEDKGEMMKTFGKFKGSTAKLYDRRIRSYGSLSIITGRAKFYLKSVLVAEVLYTETWIYRNNQFYFIGWQGTMTGLPSYYGLIVTILVLIIVYFIARLIIKKTRKPKMPVT